MKALKTFVRNGRRYKPGETIADELDAETVAHYRRLDMIELPDAGHGQAAKAVAAAGGALVPNTPTTVMRKPRQTATTVKVPGTPEAPLATSVPKPIETGQTGPTEGQGAMPDEQRQAGPDVALDGSAAKDAASGGASLPLGPVDEGKPDTPDAGGNADAKD